MILELKMLNSDASLNDFFEVGSARFSPGIALTLNMRLHNPERNLRHVPASGATFSIDFLLSDGTTLTKIPTFLDAGDRSLITVNLSDAETTNLIGQNVKIMMTDGGVVSLACAQMGLKAVKTSC